MIEFLTTNAMYVVLIIALTVWLGIAWQIQAVENRLKKIEKTVYKHTT